MQPPHQALHGSKVSKSWGEATPFPLVCCKLPRSCPQTPSTWELLNLVSPTSSFQIFSVIDTVILDWGLECLYCSEPLELSDERKELEEKHLVMKKPDSESMPCPPDTHPAWEPESWLTGCCTFCSLDNSGTQFYCLPSLLFGTVKYDSWRLQWSDWRLGTRHLGL